MRCTSPTSPCTAPDGRVEAIGHASPVVRILITASRDWRRRGVIAAAMVRAALDYPHGRIVVVHGGARGGDTIAGQVADDIGWDVEVHPADWDGHSKRAGYLRNMSMVQAGATVCLAFIRNHSRGATMCARLAEQAGIDVRYYRDDD